MTATRFARAGELSIAWRAIGDGPLDLLVIPGLVSHVEAFHELPGYGALLTKLARFARVITFDKRGNGLSDRVSDTPSLPERVEDIHAVLDAAGSKRCAVLGISEGAALAIYFAATERARCSALALFGGFARMLAAPEYEPGLSTAAYEEFTSGTVDSWGTGRTLLALFGPSLEATPGAADIAARCERLSATPTALRGLWRMTASIDVRDALARVTQPIVIMHRAGDRIVPVAAGRWLAARAPGARYLELAGDDHFPFVGDHAPIVDAIAALLEVGPQTASETIPPVANQALALDATVLGQLVAGAPLRLPFQLGRFVVSKRLGSGGMGSVYLADDHDLGRSVALKVMHRGDDGAYQRFRREAMAIARLSHPEVVAVYELGLDATVPYLVMEYVPGGTLDRLPAPLPWRRAVRLVASAARGLGAAHAVGIVHRDIKPANLLLVDPDGDRVKVADFGIAKLTGDDTLTSAGTLLGTVGYLSPEQARGDAADARSDVWALGATLYRLVTGRAPFTGSLPEILAATLARGLPDPRDVVAELPSEVAELCRQLGNLDPARRPVDGTAAAELLRVGEA